MHGQRGVDPDLRGLPSLRSGVRGGGASDVREDPLDDLRVFQDVLHLQDSRDRDDDGVPRT